MAGVGKKAREELKAVGGGGKATRTTGNRINGLNVSTVYKRKYPGRNGDTALKLAQKRKKIERQSRQRLGA